MSLPSDDTIMVTFAKYGYCLTIPNDTCCCCCSSDCMNGLVEKQLLQFNKFTNVNDENRYKPSIFQKYKEMGIVEIKEIPQFMIGKGMIVKKDFDDTIMMNGKIEFIVTSIEAFAFDLGSYVVELIRESPDNALSIINWADDIKRKYDFIIYNPYVTKNVSIYHPLICRLIIA